MSSMVMEAPPDPGAVWVSEEVAAVLEYRRAAERVAALDLAGVSPDDQMTMAREMVAARRSADAAMANVLAELERSGATDIAYGMRTGAWLAHETNDPKGGAQARTRIGVRLRGEFAVAGAALAAGTISWAHVQVLDHIANRRVVDDIVRLLPELIALAEVASFDRWRSEVTGLARRLDQDGGYNPAGDEATNRLRLRDLADGMIHLDGDLVGELAQRLRHLLETETDMVWREHRDLDELTSGDLPPRSRDQHRATALDRLVRRGAAVDLASTKPPVTEMVLVMRADDPDRLTNLDGHPVQPTILRALSGEVVLRPLVVDDNDNPLWMGREIRLANRAQRRALAFRDGGCVFPGCDCPASWADAHHVIRDRDGGPTDIRNLALLCRFHHGVTHRRGWTMYATDDQWFTWTTPTGVTLYSQRHGRQRAGPAPNTAA